MLVKYVELPTGNCPGLQNAWNSRMKSAAVTWRGGEEFQSTPERMWYV